MKSPHSTRNVVLADLKWIAGQTDVLMSRKFFSEFYETNETTQVTRSYVLITPSFDNYQQVYLKKILVAFRPSFLGKD